jgi:hypothetical protein
MTPRQHAALTFIRDYAISHGGMSPSSSPSDAEYQQFLRNVTGLSAVAVFPNPEAGRIDFAVAGLPTDGPDRARLRAIAGHALLRIEARLIPDGARA